MQDSGRVELDWLAAFAGNKGAGKICLVEAGRRLVS
jgi:hypothetical protein